MPYIFQSGLQGQFKRQHKDNGMLSNGQLEFRKYGRILLPYMLPQNMLYMYGYENSTEDMKKIQSDIYQLWDYLKKQKVKERIGFYNPAEMTTEETLDKLMIRVFDIENTRRNKKDIIITDHDNIRKWSMLFDMCDIIIRSVGFKFDMFETTEFDNSSYNQ